MKNNRLTNQSVFGIDIGGSHITLGLVDMLSRTIAHDFILRKHVDSNDTSEEILSGWCDAIKEIWKELKVENAALTGGACCFLNVCKKVVHKSI
jgi:glucokinase